MPDLKTTALDMDEAASVVNPNTYRASGLHVGTLIKEAARVAGKEYKGPQLEGIMPFGLMWEIPAQSLAFHWANDQGLKLITPFHMERDGVVGSLDGMLLDPQMAYESVVEIKTRWAAPADPRDNWRWMTQTKAYCHMTRVRKALQGPVLYLQHRPPTVSIQMHELEFSDRELTENWQMLMNMKEHLEKQGKI